MRSKLASTITLLIVCLLACDGALAQGQRDPTLPPMGPGQSAPGASTEIRARADTGRNAMAIVVIDGQAHLAQGGRLYTQGQQMGPAWIERITETEVWLRQGGKLRKLSIFTGVQRRVADPAAAPSCSPGATGIAPASETSTNCGAGPL